MITPDETSLNEPKKAGGPKFTTKFTLKLEYMYDLELRKIITATDFIERPVFIFFENMLELNLEHDSIFTNEYLQFERNQIYHPGR